MGARSATNRTPALLLSGSFNRNLIVHCTRAFVDCGQWFECAKMQEVTRLVRLIGHFEPCMTEIYLHIDARMAVLDCRYYCAQFPLAVLTVAQEAEGWEAVLHNSSAWGVTTGLLCNAKVVGVCGSWGARPYYTFLWSVYIYIYYIGHLEIMTESYLQFARITDYRRARMAPVYMMAQRHARTRTSNS